VWVVTAKIFQKALGDSQSRPAVFEVVFNALGISAEQVTPVGLVLGIAGFVALAVRGGRRSLSVLLSSLVFFNLLSQAMFKTFEPNNPDVHGYFALSAGCLALGVALAVGAFERMAMSAVDRTGKSNVVLGGWLSGSAVVALGVLTVVNGALTLPRARLDGFHDVEIFADAALDGLPPDSLLFTSDFQTCFNLWYAQGVEQSRPDVIVVHRSWLNEDTYVRSLSLRHPELLKLALSPGDSYNLDLAAVLDETKRRPVYVEFGEGLRPDLLPYLVPDGLFFRVASEPLAQGPMAPSSVRREVLFWDEFRGRLGTEGRGLDPETQAALLWRHFLAAKVHLAKGNRALAAFHIERALELNPESAELRDLQQRL
jgi:hypothetical protein